jgi:HPt (histidine-containing phosphotransfer) domain-containing protein
MPSLDLSNSIEQIQSQIEAVKTYTEVSKSEKSLLKKAANSSSKSTAQLATQLDKFKDLQKRYLKDPPNSMDQLLGFLDQTRGSGSESLKYLRKQVLDVAVKMEPKVAAIVKEQTIKALGCSQEQTYNGVSSSNLQIQPLPLRDPIEGIYIPISSVDLFSNLKNSPETEVGKVYYEKPDPSADTKFKPYGGDVDFPMNKQLYQLTTTNNIGRSYSVINGKNYTGKSGQNLFDVQYTQSNNFGVTGDYYRVLLIDRQDGTGNITNNVGEFLSDYYSTIKLVDPVDVGAQLVNLVSGALNTQANVGFGELQNQSEFEIILQRILGLCFDNRREIDVSGVAKVAELDGVDDQFFQLTEVDLRNIQVKITNVQNGVMEFEDCNNVKLPVDYGVLVDQLIDFRNSQTGQTSEQQVASIESIIDSISQNPDWKAVLPANFNAELSINKNIIKQIPLAVAAGVLTPKVLLPLYTLLSVVQSGATYTYNQAVTSANTFVTSANTAFNAFGNAGANIGKEGSNIVTSGTEFIQKYKTFVIQTVSKINGEFLRTLYEVLKKDILNLISLVINDISKSQRFKKYTIILKLIAITLFVSQLIDDYRRCKSLMSNILYLLNLIGGLGKGTGIPIPLLLASQFLPGYSSERATINAIEGLQKLGIPTGTMPDGSPNLMLLYNLITNKAVDKENAENGKTEIVLTGGVTGVGKSY